MDVDLLRDRVSKRMEELSLQPIPTAVQAGLGRDFIRDLLAGKKKSVRGDKLPQLAAALSVSTDYLLGGAPAEDEGGSTQARTTVPLVGYVGAGDAAHFYDVDQGELDNVEAPDTTPAAVSAREIRGRSMGMFYEGWLVFTGERQTGVPDIFVGSVCEVKLPDGRVLIKQVRRAKLPGLFHLYSETEEPMLDEEVEWSAKVLDMRQR